MTLLERVTVRREDRPNLRAALRSVGCYEAVLLSTCSRVEIYVGSASPGKSELVNMLLDVLAKHSGAAHDELMAVVEVRTGQAAVDHLAGLGIQPNVAARDEAYAARLAGPGAVCPLTALTRGIAAADLLICTTSATQHVVTVDHVSRAMAGRTNPMTVVDLSVPRNVETAVAKVPGVTLIDVEGLADEGTAAPTMAAALSTAAAMASAAARKFAEGVAARDAGPVIAALRHRVEQICRAELVNSAGWGALDPEALTRSAHAIAGKLLHRPTIAARQAAAAGDSDGLRQLCDMFGVPPADVGMAEPGSDSLPIAG